ncbi:MAG: hypothetical protein LC775_20680, partial [Acidobacteria bacterium]|nr:hypothetical protein [Acidobacteriota bacterium]
IKNSTSADDFKAYLTRYPTGQFAELATNRIKSLEVVTKPVEPEPAFRNSDAVEIAFWDSVKNSTNAGDFRAYLERYPNGQFVTLAKNRLVPLDAAEKEKAKEEEAKRLEAEVAKPLKSFQIDHIQKFGWRSFTYPANLIFFRAGFRILRDANEPCHDYRLAKTDGVQIREIRSDKICCIRLRFQSAAEANEALAEIQRICKANP